MTRSQIKTLAARAYPNLKATGVCSKHKDDGHTECTICYPDFQMLWMLIKRDRELGKTMNNFEYVRV